MRLQGIYFGFCLLLCIGCNQEKAALVKQDTEDSPKTSVAVTVNVKKPDLPSPQQSVQSVAFTEGAAAIISEGRWFFSARNLKDGYTDYYNRYGIFLGQKRGNQ